MKKKIPIRRLLALTLAVLMIFTLAACGNHEFDSYRPITDINNLEGRKIGVNLAWSADYLLSERDDMILYRYDETADMLMALCYEQLDAVAVDYITGTYILAYTTGLNRVEQELATEGYITVFGREQTALVDEYNAWLAEYVESDEYAAWMQRVLDFDGDNYEPENMEMTGTGPVLHCATYLDNFPLTFADAQGNQNGFEMEIMIAFANAMNYQLDITLTSEMDMFNGISSGMYEFVFGSLSELYVDDYLISGFHASEPYMYLPIYILEIADHENLGLSGFIDVWGEDE